MAEFDYPVPLDDADDAADSSPIKDFLRRLEHVQLFLSEKAFASIAPHLASVRTLTLTHFGSVPDVDDTRTPAKLTRTEARAAFANLQKLQAANVPENVIGALFQTFPLPKLVALHLDETITSTIQLEHILPSLPNLLPLQLHRI